jgi:hypothetical protein
MAPITYGFLKVQCIPYIWRIPCDSCYLSFSERKYVTTSTYLLMERPMLSLNLQASTIIMRSEHLHSKISVQISHRLSIFTPFLFYASFCSFHILPYKIIIKTQDAMLHLFVKHKHILVIHQYWTHEIVCISGKDVTHLTHWITPQIYCCSRFVITHVYN